MTTWRHHNTKVMFSRALDTVGNGTGTSNAVGTYATPTDFFIKPAAGQVFEITRMIVNVVDTVGMDADAYGNGITLTNGIKIFVADDTGDLFEITDAANPIKTNGDWAHYCYDADIKTWGTGNEHLVVRWTFAKAGQPIVLHSTYGQKLIVRLNDTFTGLVEHNFIVQGVKRESY